MLYRIITDAGDDAINSGGNMMGAALNAPKIIWKDFAKGTGGAIIGFGIEQWSNSIERGIEDDTRIQSIYFNNEDANDHIGVYATHS